MSDDRNRQILKLLSKARREYGYSINAKVRALQYAGYETGTRAAANASNDTTKCSTRR